MAAAAVNTSIITTALVPTLALLPLLSFLLLMALLRWLSRSVLAIIWKTAEPHFFWPPDSSSSSSQSYDPYGFFTLEQPHSSSPGEPLIRYDGLRVIRRLEVDEEEAVRCVFCLCDVVGGDEVRELRCGHVFHRVCLDRWSTHGGSTCPLCRERLVAAPEPVGKTGLLLMGHL